MPITYTFKNRGGVILVNCALECTQCTSTTKAGQPCRRTACIGVKYCWSHLLTEKKLRILESEHGKGVFAVDRRQPPGAVLFRRWAKVIEYDGLIVPSETVHQRYGRYTAPYAIQLDDDTMEDAACHRGVGAMVNHAEGDAVNARFETVDGHLCVRATRYIRNGEQILVDYGEVYDFEDGGQHETKRRRVTGPLL